MVRLLKRERFFIVKMYRSKWLLLPIKADVRQLCHIACFGPDLSADFEGELLDLARAGAVTGDERLGEEGLCNLRLFGALEFLAERTQQL